MSTVRTKLPLAALGVLWMAPRTSAIAAPTSDTTEICSLRAPDSYVHFIGKSYEKKDALAGPAARIDAEKQVEDKVCASLSARHLCRIATAPARRFREGRGADGSMCSVYQMKADALDPMSKAATDLAGNLKKQVRALSLSTSSSYSLARAQNSANGCGVGRLGRALSNELRKNITVSDTDVDEVVTPLVDITSDRVLVQLEYRKGTTTSAFSDPVDLTNYTQFIGWDPAETQCGTSSSAPTWLRASRNTGNDLLKIDGEATLCSGNTVTLNAFPPASAKHVDLVTIEPNGKAYFMASRPTTGEATVNLGQFAVYSGMEAITATVSAAFRSVGGAVPIKTPCELTAEQVEDFGKNAAAVGSLSYDVAANGEQRCSVTEESATRAENIKNMIANIPMCSF